jgi:hypothetical protein
MIQSLYNEYRLAEARNHIPAGLALMATAATVLEAGCVSFYRNFFGQKLWNEESIRARESRTEDTVGQLKEALLSDVSRTHDVLRETHTTTDFPILLSRIRDRIIRQGYNSPDSTFPSIAAQRPVSDFKLIQGVKIGGIGELAVRPEGEDVDYITFGYSEDGYRIANLEKAIRFTWEMWKNDDIGMMERGMEELGKAARRTRTLVCLRAIAAGLPQTTVGTAGGPTPTRLEEAMLVLADRVSEAASDGTTEPEPREGTDLFVPLNWKFEATRTLNSAELHSTGDKAAKHNAMQGAATLHAERYMKKVLGKDWLLTDNENPFLELAVLDDFRGGPATYTRIPDVREHPDQGTFRNHTFDTKVGDACGAKVIEPKNALRVKGE